MEIGCRIVTKRPTRTSPTRQRQSLQQPSAASMRPQSAKLNAKFHDLALRPEKKKRGRPTTAKSRDVKFTPEYPQRGQHRNHLDRIHDTRKPTATAELWSDEEDDDGGVLGDDPAISNTIVAAPNCSKLKMTVVQSILQREECLATIVERCREGRWGSEGTGQILPLLVPLRLHSLAVVESIQRWKAAANNRAFVWDDASYLHKMTTDTDILDQYLSLELGFPVVRNPFLSSMALDTPQLTLLVCCPHKPHRTDHVVQCIARRLHFGDLEPGDMTLNARVISALVAIVKEEMERRLDEEATKSTHPHKTSCHLDILTLNVEPESEGPVVAAQNKHTQRQQLLHQTAASSRQLSVEKQRASPSKQNHQDMPLQKPCTNRLGNVPLGASIQANAVPLNDEPVNADLRRIFALCSDVTTAASHLQRQLHVLDTVTQDATTATNSHERMVPLRSSLPFHASSLATPGVGDSTSAELPLPNLSSSSTTAILGNQDNLTSYIDTLSARIARLRALDADSALDTDYVHIAHPRRDSMNDDTSPLPIEPRLHGASFKQSSEAPSLEKFGVKRMVDMQHNTQAKTHSTNSLDPSSRRSPVASKKSAKPHDRSDKAVATQALFTCSKQNRVASSTRSTPLRTSLGRTSDEIAEDANNPGNVVLHPSPVQAKRDNSRTGQPPRQNKPRMPYEAIDVDQPVADKRPVSKIIPRDAEHARRRKTGDHRMHCVAQHRAALRLQAWWRYILRQRSRYQSRRCQAFAVQTIEWAYMRHRRRRRSCVDQGGRSEDEKHAKVATMLQEWARRRTAIRREWRARCYKKHREVAGRSIQRSWREYRQHKTTAIAAMVECTWKRMVTSVWTHVCARSHAAATIQRSYLTWQFNRQAHLQAAIIEAAPPIAVVAPQPSILAETSRGCIPPLLTTIERTIQDQYADEGFESDASGGRDHNADPSSTRGDICRATPNDCGDDNVYTDDTIPEDVDPKAVLMPYFVLWMTNRLRRIQYRDLVRRAKRERVRLACKTWHDQSRRSRRVRTAFRAWNDQTQFEKDKRVQTRNEFALSAKAWKQLQRGKLAAKPT
ncbi:hypothetical protein H310_03892 [Aphanomyces invadans]|uniref:Uncharacterized protein n=1 Tax=Aphanomyces invadans TaxID=157072 RepID=A0A024UEP0_9STRA|nr:hypothetical protein H310_03892 [Aphanomyces invadans]ETW04744.1 hypothetical protein H310_03892 [Aphanomyces invadans]|eukprot:XP_008866182.1 hypothetical protein H310_03892 [Aphanomyces invadans]